MNNKPIIIDEINVSECEHFTQEQPQFDITCLFNASKNKNKCEDSPNCYYKQLQRKKQECEKLQREIKHRADAENSLNDLCTKLESENINLKEDLTALQQTYTACEKEYKALNEKYIKVLDQLGTKTKEISEKLDAALDPEKTEAEESMDLLWKISEDLENLTTSFNVDKKGG